MRPWKLAETNYAQVKDNRYEVALLPLGATEPHNLHLPYGTDCFEAEIVGEKICEAAHAGGARVVLLPTIPYGTENNLKGFPLAINVNPSTLFAFITDIVDSLAHSGIHKIVLLNSHGGNDMKPLLRELSRKHAGPPVSVQLVSRACGHGCAKSSSDRDDHAGEMETSFGLAYFPQLVARNPDGSLAADEGQMAPTRFEAINKGWVSITRPWHLLTTNSGAGNPHGASAEKGRRMMELLVERLSKFLVELSAAKLDQRFPF